MLYAVLADIHANYPALLAVAEDARKVAQAEGTALGYVCLGDVVDYGPQPNECVRWVQQNRALLIAGNHDEDTAAPREQAPLSIAPDLWPITRWTQRVLGREATAVMRAWPRRLTQPEGLAAFTLFHGTLTAYAPFGRLENPREAEESFQQLTSPYGLFGHTHYQGYFEEDGTGAVKTYLVCPTGVRPQSAEAWKAFHDLGVWRPLPFGRAFFNPGSVGQPRRYPTLSLTSDNHDRRACYLLLRKAGPREWQFQFRRVSYAVADTIAQLRTLTWPEGPPAPEAAYAGPARRQLQAAETAEALHAVVERRLIPTLLYGG